MIVDLIGIYVLKGPYCTLTMTDWFLQALSVIPRGSWGDVARRFTMVRWSHAPPAFVPRAVAVCCRLRGWTCSDHLDEEIPSVINSSQTGEGAMIPVVDRIRRTQPPTVEVPISL
ncbi:hypothetical protein F511_39528 [Dorcoceras hygrometricum]|uniref:Uncharacterized protein n=1 Tax=Dorcoceras hygrometricum TaxID=472368 RepID=A0A2Z7CCJ5_9LAMI|nr:hypothetical protein F511_39528 [Dorcoceras hygrometricum]